MEPLVNVRVDGSTGTIILNRPEKRNALSRGVLDALLQALRDLHLQRSVRAVILTGAGDAFCSGVDLAEILAATKQGSPHQTWHDDVLLYRYVLEEMLQFPKPLIAAVNGAAVAGGCGLLLACDIVVAADSATFCLPEPRRGLVAGMVSPLLVFRIGSGHAAYLLLTAAGIDARQAQRLGLFHELVPVAKTWARGMELAAECAKGAPQALQATKRMLNETIGENLRMLLTTGAAVSATARTTDAAAEGLAAFLEKRDPLWD